MWHWRRLDTQASHGHCWDCVVRCEVEFSVCAFARVSKLTHNRRCLRAGLFAEHALFPLVSYALYINITNTGWVQNYGWEWQMLEVAFHLAIAGSWTPSGDPTGAIALWLLRCVACFFLSSNSLSVSPSQSLFTIPMSLTTHWLLYRVSMTIRVVQ